MCPSCCHFAPSSVTVFGPLCCVAGLRAGDSLHTSRVLHVAYRDARVVGCASSTTGWDGPYCGQWGFLAVAVSDQGTGVGRALVRAAEERLANLGQRRVQIEYHCRPCTSDGRQLHAWYSRLGFRPTLGSACCIIGCCPCMTLATCEVQTFCIAKKALSPVLSPVSASTESEGASPPSPAMMRI